MNKILQIVTVLCIYAGVPNNLHAQTTATVASGTLVSLNSANGNPIYCSSATSTFIYSFSSHLVTPAQLAAQSITTGSIITGMAFEKATTSTLAAGRTATLSVYAKNSSQTAFPTGQTRATLLAGSTQVYNNTNQTLPATAGWVTVNFNTPIVYTGGALEFVWDWGISPGVGNPTTGSFTWLYTNTTGAQASGTSSGSVIPPSATCVNQTRAYNMQLIYSSGAACTGTPTPGNTVGPSAVCPNVNFSVSPQNTTTGSGISYQWQVSPNATTWANVATGGTNALYTGSQTSPNFYRCLVSCGAATAATTPLFVNASLFSNCYCQTGAATNTADEDIFGVTINGSTNTSNCATLAPGAGSIPSRYSNYVVDTTPTFSARAGTTVPLSIDINTCGGGFNHQTAIWIDTNHSGTFDANEQVYATTLPVNGTNTIIGTFNLPLGAALGNTGLRIKNVEASSQINTADACTSYIWGETEDYLIKILPPIVANESYSDIFSLKTYPNPTKGLITLHLDLRQAADVHIDIVHTTGQKVANQTMNHVTNQDFDFDFSNLPVGMYFAHIRIGNETKIVKMVRIE
jgi:GEVED domain/Secretion system C-terminal sorting domain